MNEPKLNPKPASPKPISENTPEETTLEAQGWRPYNLDYYAQELVLKYRDKKNVLNESHKMRMAVAYGLERFWGEHLRLKQKSDTKLKGEYWKDVWDKLADILEIAGVELPKDKVGADDTEKIGEIVRKIWNLSHPKKIWKQRVALMVLTQFCDCLVWWTQRYKKAGD